MAEVRSRDPSKDVAVLGDSAVSHLNRLAAEKGCPVTLRVFVTGGGCSGFKYEFDVCEGVEDDDTVIKAKGATLVIDSLSLPYLVGSTVDFTKDIMGQRFIVSNPNAQTTCGCGESFSVAS